MSKIWLQTNCGEGVSVYYMQTNQQAHKLYIHAGATKNQVNA